MSEHDPVKEYARMAIRKKQEEAKARVEEAAPDLLAALKGLLAYVEDKGDAHGFHTAHEPEVERARAAIAKAEGEK